MASTTLFAPQVRAVQPAFVYNKDSESKVKIYFNLSSYNTVNDIKYILYTIIDPNKASTWGTNSVVETTAAPVGYLYVSFAIEKTEATPVANRLYYTLESSGKYVYEGKLNEFETGKNYYYFNQDQNTGEYYIEINLGDNTKFKELTKNQFYQVQLYFCDTTTSAPTDDDKINNQWLNINKDNISVASQATLIRPIPSLDVGYPNIETLSGTLYDLSLIKGEIVYEDNSMAETIDTCWFEVGSKKSEIIKNQLGLGFEIPIKFSLNAGNYTGNLHYITKNGYQKDQAVSFTITPYGTSGSSLSVVESNSLGYISIPGNAKNKLQRKEESQVHWDTIHTYIDDNLYYDYDIENLNEYHYRLINGNVASTTTSAVKVSFEDIFLSDENTMLAVRYNPNISNFKYVTQEAITNTLGGKYPIIRKNGDTRYRQFSLSGTLFMNASSYTNSQTLPASWHQNVKDWFNSNDEVSLYVKENDPRIKTYNTKERLERQAREVAIDFLTNGGVKLFRSPEEGNMIVYLSNVSFTPNKQLGRAVWDFSATVTEICEYSMENINKYKLNDGNEFKKVLKNNLSQPSKTPVTTLPQSSLT